VDPAPEAEAAAPEAAATAGDAPKGAAAAADEGVGCHLRILHVNDVYELDNFPFLKAAVDDLSKGVPPSNVLTTLAGDFLGPSLLSSLDNGKSMVDCMNRLPVKAVCFGNHESDVPYSSLTKRVAEFKGAWLNSNMLGFDPAATPDNVVLELEGGRRVGLVGLNIGGGENKSLYRDGAFGGHVDGIVPVMDALESAVARCKEAHGELDAVIPLTHQDMPDDIRAAETGLFPVVLGGHDHGVFHHVAENGCHVVKAGEDAYNVVVLDLRWAPGAPRGAMPSVEYELVPVAAPRKAKDPAPELRYQVPDEEMARAVERWQTPARELQTAVLAMYEPGALSSVGVREHPSSMAEQIATALRTAVKAEGCLINSGGVRAKKLYTDGQVTYADLSMECPFPSSNVVVPIPGSVLREAVRVSREAWDRGEADASAFQLDKDMATDAESGLLVQVDGKPLEEEREYAILVDKYMVGVNSALAAYAAECPGKIPPDDAGRPVLPLLVDYFCGEAWKALTDKDGSGAVDDAEVDAFFDEADADHNGMLDQEEIFRALQARLKGMASNVLAQQMITLADFDADGKVSREELRKCLTERAEEMI